MNCSRFTGRVIPGRLFMFTLWSTWRDVVREYQRWHVSEHPPLNPRIFGFWGLFRSGILYRSSTQCEFSRVLRLWESLWKTPPGEPSSDVFRIIRRVPIGFSLTLSRTSSPHLVLQTVFIDRLFWLLEHTRSARFFPARCLHIPLRLSLLPIYGHMYLRSHDSQVVLGVANVHVDAVLPLKDTSWSVAITPAPWSNKQLWKLLKQYTWLPFQRDRKSVV